MSVFDIFQINMNTPYKRTRILVLTGVDFIWQFDCWLKVSLIIKYYAGDIVSTKAMGFLFCFGKFTLMVLKNYSVKTFFHGRLFVVPRQKSRNQKNHK